MEKETNIFFSKVKYLSAFHLLINHNEMLITEQKILLLSKNLQNRMYS